MSKNYLDTEILDNMQEMERMLNKRMLSKLIEMYFAQVPTDIENMLKSLLENDYDSFCRIAHTLKSSSGSVGAKVIAEIAGQLEAWSYPYAEGRSERPTSVDQWRSLVQELPRHFKNTQELLKTYMT